MANQVQAVEPRGKPPFFRFSIQHLLLWTAAVGIACVALRSSSQFWISTMHALALGSLTVAIMLAIYRRGAVRAYWLGFAICGWLYVGIQCFGWGLPAERRWLVPLDHDQLLTTWLSKQTYQYAYPFMAPRPPVSNLGGGGFVVGPPPPPAFSGVPEHEFVNTAHAIWTLLLAACGGSFARWLYLTRDREPN